MSLSNTDTDRMDDRVWDFLQLQKFSTEAGILLLPEYCGINAIQFLYLALFNYLSHLITCVFKI